MEKCLVTGGSGYFGSLLVRELCARGYGVCVLDLHQVEDYPPGVEFMRGDIRDVGLLKQICAGVDVIYHTVAQQPLAKDKRLFWSVNVEGTANLFQAAWQHRVRKLIHLSSSAVFGIPKTNPFDETVIPTPIEAYGRAKWEAENLVAQYVSMGLDITIIRPSTIVGPGRLGTFSILFDWVRSNAMLPVLGRGDNRYQFVHVADLAHACLLAAEKSGADTFNIGTDRVETMREMYEALIQHAGSTSRIIALPMGFTVGTMKALSVLGLSPLGDYHLVMYGRDKIFDVTKARSKLAWTPQYSNTEMICEAYDWFSDNYAKAQAESRGSPNRRIIRQGILHIFKWLLR